jgi:hypothetical protein
MVRRGGAVGYGVPDAVQRAGCAASGENSISRPQRRDNRIQPVGERGRTGLQDQRRFDLDNAVVADRRNLVSARPFFDPVRHDFLAAPRCQNDIGGGGAHDIGQNDPILGGLLKPQLWAEMNAETRGFSPLTCGGRTA